jgi:hypothetical protein
MFRQYNASMGGVDLMDNMVACYRVPYRIKKWWFPFYTWSLRFVPSQMKIFCIKVPQIFLYIEIP